MLRLRCYQSSFLSTNVVVEKEAGWVSLRMVASDYLLTSICHNKSSQQKKLSGISLKLVMFVTLL